MLTLEKDVAKLCTEALASGRSAFTYAMCLRVNLAFNKDAGWALVAVVIDAAMDKLLGDTAAGLMVLCSMIEKSIGNELHFAKPEIAPSPPGSGPAWLVRSTGGPKPGATTDVDLAACERVVRYAKRDGKGTVTTNGWRIHLHKNDDRWLLEADDQIRLETREDLSKRHYQLGQLHATLSRLLQAPIHMQKLEVGGMHEPEPDSRTSGGL